MNKGWTTWTRWAGWLLAAVVVSFLGFKVWEGYSKRGTAIGSFSVSTIPPGAMVRWKGRELGKTPVMGCALPAGDQVIELTAPGFQSYPVEFSIKPSSTVDLGLLTLARELGRIGLVTDPAGIAFQAHGPDQKMISGTTPATIENLPFGKYEVTLSEPGWPTCTQVVEVRSTDLIEIVRQFRGGQVTLSSDPPGAAIFVDGSKLGSTPLTANLPVSPLQVTSRFGSLVPVVQTLVPDAERVVSLRFKHSYGTLAVSSDRTDALLIVDGIDYGHPPAELFLPPGNRKILLTAPNAPDKTRRVDLLDGQRVSVQILFGGAMTDVAVSGTPTPSLAIPGPGVTPAVVATVTPGPPSKTEWQAPTPVVASTPSSESPTVLSTPPTPETTAESKPTPPLAPNDSNVSHAQPAPMLMLKKSSPVGSNTTPNRAIKRTQAKTREEAYHLLDAEWKQKQTELEAEKKNIELQIRNSTGAIREQWKYRLAQWRLKKAQADRDETVERAKLEEQWK